MTCSVCGMQVGPGHDDFAVVGREEYLCASAQKSCFAWFSGYPWVLFEMGMLVSRLWEPGDDEKARIDAGNVWMSAYGTRWNTWGNW